MHKLAHPDGEIAVSKAAADCNIPMALSSYSACSLEEVGAQGKGNPYAAPMCVLWNRSVSPTYTTCRR